MPTTLTLVTDMRQILDRPRPDFALEELTLWFAPGVHPVRIGEYNASEFRNAEVLRWWDGKAWSCMYFAGEPEDYKAKSRLMIETASTQPRIQWRGLKYDPAEARV
jgi:hypothetical protein